MKFKKFLFPASVLTMTLLLVGQGCVSGTPNSGTYSGPAGMFASLDNGENWQAISKYPSAEGVKELNDTSVYKVEEDPQDPHTLYWASRANGMLFTYNDGKTWQKPTGVLAEGFIYDVAVSPQNKCVIYATNGSAVLRSDDCNRNWIEVYRETRTDVKVVSLELSSFTENEVWASTSNGDIIRSRDKGTNWATIKRFGLSIGDLMLDKNQKNTIYVASRRNGLFKSIDGGENWVNYNKEIKEFTKGLEYRSFYLHPNKANTIYWISTYGIIVSEDGGANWKALELLTPPGSVSVYGFAINPKNDKEIYYSASSQARSTLYRSEDGGISWMTKRLPSGQLPTAIHINSGDIDAVYVGFTIPPKS